MYMIYSLKEPRPQKELKGFDKIYLKAGESKQVEIELDEDAFGISMPTKPLGI